MQYCICVLDIYKCGSPPKYRRRLVDLTFGIYMYMSDDTVCLGAIHLTPKHTYLPLFNDDTLESLQDALDNVELYMLYISFYLLG